MKILLAIFGLALVISARASEREKVPLGEVADHAVEQSKLTLTGSKPFHLKAEIVETTNPSSEYRGKIEEYWVSPEKWRRTIETPDFSQTLIVNGDQVSEKDTGDYLPWWLNELVIAMTDPLPMVEQLKQLNSQMAKPQGSENSNTCADLRTKVDRSVFCFEGSHGLLTSVFTRGYSAQFEDFKGFAGKRVPHLIVIVPESGTTIQARITELTEFHQDGEALFAVPTATPARDQIKTVKVDESTVRALALNGTEISWPPGGGGPTTGRCAIYLSADRTGHVREVWPGGCDNPGLEDPLRAIVSKWQLKPAVQNGIPVQIEASVTFTFETRVVDDHSAPKESKVEAPGPATNGAVNNSQRKGPIVVQPRVIELVKPDCHAGQSCFGIHGTVIVDVNVLVDGTVGDVRPTGDTQLFEVATRAAKQCRFQPGTFLGKPTSMGYTLKYEF